MLLLSLRAKILSYESLLSVIVAVFMRPKYATFFSPNFLLYLGLRLFFESMILQRVLYFAIVDRFKNVIVTVTICTYQIDYSFGN